MTQVKICGINDPLAFDAAVEAGADWIGLVFFSPSPRFITPAVAAALSSRKPGGPPRVGLFVEPTEAMIAAVLESVKLDILQVYGAADRLGAIKRRFGLPIWRAIGINTAADLPTTAPEADRLLLEAKPPAGAEHPGGNATTFDWSILRGWNAPAPWVLAGGLTPQNVATAVQQTGANAVDVSSGVESRKGVKDPARIQAFITNAKAAT
jgi:phosphoribosylanthranilate isomerase